jgi:hypothetical protein
MSVYFNMGHDIVAYWYQINQNIENQTTKTSDFHNLVWIESSCDEDSPFVSTLDTIVIRNSGGDRFGSFTCLFPSNYDCDIWQPPDIS